MPDAPPEPLTLLPSWVLSLRADRRSPATVSSYRQGVLSFAEWCHGEGRPAALDRPTARAFVAHLLESGREPATARSRLMALKRFSAWLEAEGEIDRDELAGLAPPKLDAKVTPRLTEPQCAALVKACQGKGFMDRRDEAIVRLALETGLRAGELVGLRVDDIDPGNGLATIRRGKGGAGRVVPFGPQTARALDRYARMRRGHRLADLPNLWLGGGQQTFGYHALRDAMAARARVAGVDGFHFHLLRHTAAQRWLAAGGSEGGLMAVAGWKSRDMLDRYTRASAATRAADEARRLNLGEL